MTEGAPAGTQGKDPYGPAIAHYLATHPGASVAQAERWAMQLIAQHGDD